MELQEVINKIEEMTDFLKTEVGDETLRQLKLYRCLQGSYNAVREQYLNSCAIANLFKDPYFKGFEPKEIIILAKSSLSVKKENSNLISNVVKIQTYLEQADYEKALKLCKRLNPYEVESDVQNEKI